MSPSPPRQHQKHFGAPDHPDSHGAVCSASARHGAPPHPIASLPGGTTSVGHARQINAELRVAHHQDELVGEQVALDAQLTEQH
jgi:hypothetical protein